MVGLAFLQGPHHVAQKSRRTTLPLRVEFVCFEPLVSLRLKLGAALPSRVLVLFCATAEKTVPTSNTALTAPILSSVLFMVLSIITLQAHKEFSRPTFLGIIGRDETLVAVVNCSAGF